MERVHGEVELALGRAGEGPDPLVCLHGITAQHRAFNALARNLVPDYSLAAVDLRGRGDSEKPETGYGLDAHASDVIRTLDHLGLDNAVLVGHSMGGFVALARNLVPGYSLAAVDLRGRGDSEKPETGYGLDAHASDVIRILDHLGLESAVLVGHSMGGFVALQTALGYPDRVRALVLLDGGWPRVERSVDELSEEEKREAEEMSEGLARAFSRLDMVFESPDDYLNFWFPGQGLTMRDLPPDLAGYYLYDLGEVDGGYQPKASRKAAEEDSPWVSSHAPTANEMRAVGCPVALVRPSNGFFPDSEPLISPSDLATMKETLDIRSDTRLEGANHYSMLFGEPARKTASAIEAFLQQTG